ncbi:unnamed protein product, partial [Closterium sp. Naga37s-1]
MQRSRPGGSTMPPLILVSGVSSGLPDAPVIQGPLAPLSTAAHPA